MKKSDKIRKLLSNKTTKDFLAIKKKEDIETEIFGEKEEQKQQVKMINIMEKVKKRIVKKKD